MAANQRIMETLACENKVLIDRLERSTDCSANLEKAIEESEKSKTHSV